MQALTGNKAAPASARLKFHTEATLTVKGKAQQVQTPIKSGCGILPSQRSNWLFTLVGKPWCSCCLPVQLVWAGGEHRWLQSRSNLSPRHDNAVTHADTQFNPNR